jgi:hypothetical protein
VSNVEFIFEPAPTGGGHGECITDDQPFLRLGSTADLEVSEELNAYLEEAPETGLIALEVSELSEADAGPIREFAAAHNRAVFVRRAT